MILFARGAEDVPEMVGYWKRVMHDDNERIIMNLLKL